MIAFVLHIHQVFHPFKVAHPTLSKEGGAVLLISSVAALRGCPASVACAGLCHRLARDIQQRPSQHGAWRDHTRSETETANGRVSSTIRFH